MVFPWCSPDFPHVFYHLGPRLGPSVRLGGLQRGLEDCATDFGASSPLASRVCRAKCMQDTIDHTLWLGIEMEVQWGLVGFDGV